MSALGVVGAVLAWPNGSGLAGTSLLGVSGYVHTHKRLARQHAERLAQAALHHKQSMAQAAGHHEASKEQAAVRITPVAARERM